MPISSEDLNRVWVCFSRPKVGEGGLTNKEVGEEERSEVVDLGEQVKVVLGVSVAQSGCSGVVEQDVETFFSLVDLFGQLPNRVQRTQVEDFVDYVRIVGELDYLFDRLLAIVPIGYYHFASSSSQVQRNLVPNTFNQNMKPFSLRYYLCRV